MDQETKDLTYGNGYRFALHDLHGILMDMLGDSDYGITLHIEIQDRMKHCLEVRESAGFNLPKETQEEKL